MSYTIPPPLPSTFRHDFLKLCRAILKLGVIVVGGLFLLSIIGGKSETTSTASTGTFDGAHIADIMQAAKHNEAKFERDYKGHLLGYVARFHSSNTTLGSRQVWFDNHTVVCHMDEATYFKTANWRPGSRVQLVGRMKRVGFMGTVSLDDCEFIQ